MATTNNSIVITFSIAILLLLALLLLVSYNSKCATTNNVEKFYDNNQHQQFNISPEIYEHRKSVGDIANTNADFNTISAGIDNYAPSDPFGNEGYDPVSNSASKAANIDPQVCAQRDRLTSDDLLPKDANSKWAQLNPSGSGDIRDQNYLTAGYHVGINTVGQSLRNANLQLRSEIPNPQVPVSPWMISTIEPDLRPVSFEIGSAPSY
jgi:hypothetical protein